LAAEGKRADGQKAVDDLGRAYQAEAPQSAALIRSAAQYHWLYAVGDFTALEAAGRADSQTTAGKTALFCALIEQNRLDEAAKVLKPAAVKDISTVLGTALAWRLVGRTDKAGVWQEALVKKLRAGDARNRLAADLLEDNAAPSPESLDNLNLAVKSKAALVANLAVMHPEARGQLNALAGRLNVERSFPYHLIQRATSGPVAQQAAAGAQ
jgi:hypothetical protein